MGAKYNPSRTGQIIADFDYNESLGRKIQQREEKRYQLNYLRHLSISHKECCIPTLRLLPREAARIVFRLLGDVRGRYSNSAHYSLEYPFYRVFLHVNH
jgi:hypothetical protein